MAAIGARGAVLQIRSFSTHGGERSGCGRKRQHGRTSDYLSLNIYQLRKAGAFRPQTNFKAWNANNVVHGRIEGSDLIIVWNRMTAALEVVQTGCPFGGSRRWFRCPQCSQRVAIIFLGSSAIGCRHCLHLRYPSQSEDWIERSKRVEESIRRKLGARRAGRPKGMHRATYGALIEKALQQEENRSLAIGLFMV